MAQVDTLQEDPPLQLNPEVALGVAAVVHEALPKPFDLGQLMEMLNRMDGNMQAQRSDMESRMDANAQKMNANAQAMKEDLQDLQTQMKGEMQNMGKAYKHK